MNPYCNGCLHQIEVALQKTLDIMHHLTDDELSLRPTPDKMSVGELLEHIATICRTDYYISLGYSQKKMTAIYEEIRLETLEEIKEAMTTNFASLKQAYHQYSDEELHTPITSYWGTSYTRFEWLAEIVAHIYHHRGQLHAILTHCYGKDLHLVLFE